MNNFKNMFNLDTRILKCKELKRKYKDKIPIILYRISNNYGDIPLIDKNKFLVDSATTIGQFMYVIRKRMGIRSEVAMYIFCNNRLPVVSMSVGQLYETDKDEDGFLYLEYSGMETFG